MSKTIAIFCVILTTFFWGTNFNAGKIVVMHIEPITAAAFRFFVAGILLFMLISPRLKHLAESIRRNFLIYIVVGVIGVAGFNGLFFLGLKYTSAINGALIMGSNPILTMLLAALVLKQPINRHQAIGMALSLVGVIVVITQGSLEALIHLRMSVGDAIIMLGNICWALYSVLVRRFVKDSSPMTTTTMSMIVGGITLLIIAALQPHGLSSLAHQSSLVYGLLIYMTICGSALSYLFWNQGMEQLGISHTALFFNLVPVFTAIVSVATGEAIHLLQVVGGALVISGVLVSMNAWKLLRRH